MEDSGPGKKDFIADLLLLSENPLDDIAHTKDIFAVIKDGNFIDKSSLEQLQKKVSQGVTVSL